jgi:hypothetical protein
MKLYFKLNQNDVNPRANCTYINNLEWEHGKIDAVCSYKNLSQAVVEKHVNMPHGTPLEVSGYTMEGDSGTKFIVRSIKLSEELNERNDALVENDTDNVIRARALNAAKQIDYREMEKRIKERLTKIDAKTDEAVLHTKLLKLLNGASAQQVKEQEDAEWRQLVDKYGKL